MPLKTVLTQASGRGQEGFEGNHGASPGAKPQGPPSPGCTNCRRGHAAPTKQCEGQPRSLFSRSLGTLLRDTEPSMAAMCHSPAFLHTVGHTRDVAGQAASRATVWPEAGGQTAQRKVPGHKGNTPYDGHLKIQKQRKRLLVRGWGGSLFATLRGEGPSSRKKM